MTDLLEAIDAAPRAIDVAIIMLIVLALTVAHLVEGRRPKC